MHKVTPNPPFSSTSESIDQEVADRVLSFYNLAPGPDNPPTPDAETLAANLREEILVNACSILDCAAATAYESADNLNGSNRKVAMGVVHLIELAQKLVDSVIEPPSGTADLPSQAR